MRPPTRPAGPAPRPGPPAADRTAVRTARALLLALLGCVLVPLVTAGLRGVLWLLLGVAALALAAAGVWWTLAHTGALRAVGAVLAVAAPLTVLGLYASRSSWPRKWCSSPPWVTPTDFAIRAGEEAWNPHCAKWSTAASRMRRRRSSPTAQGPRALGAVRRRNAGSSPGSGPSRRRRPLRAAGRTLPSSGDGLDTPVDLRAWLSAIAVRGA